MHEHGVAALDRIRRLREVVRCHPLQERRRRGRCRDTVRHFHGDCGGNSHLLGIAASGSGPRDPVAHGEFVDLGTDSFDDTAALVAGNVGERTLVLAHSEVRVDEIDADRFGLDE